MFSIDLSDPENPAVERYLTLPGFASYTQLAEHWLKRALVRS